MPSTKSSVMPPRNTRLFWSTTIAMSYAANSVSVGRISSAHSNTYVNPVQPPPRTPTRIRAFGVPRLARCLAISCAADSVIATSFLPTTGVAAAVFGSSCAATAFIVLPGVLLLVVLDRRLDRIFGEDRAVNLDRREVELRD